MRQLSEASMDEPAAHSNDTLGTSSRLGSEITLKMDNKGVGDWLDSTLGSESDQDVEITRLAKEMTATSAYSHVDTANNLFSPTPDSELDPPA